MKTESALTEEMTLDSERRLIAAVIATGGGNEYYPDSGPTSDAFGIVRTGDYFSNPFHGAIWDALQSVYNAGTPVMPSTLLSELLGERDYKFHPGTWGDVIGAIEGPEGGDAQYWRHHASRIQVAQFTRLARSKIESISGDEVSLPALERMVEDLREMEVEVDSSRSTSAELVRRLLSAQESNYANPGIKGARTGLLKLDETLGGLAKRRMTVVAARPSIGKTAAAISMMVGLLRNGHRCEFFSLEMTEEEVVTRFVAAIAGCSYAEACYQTQPSQRTHGRIAAAMQEIANFPLVVRDPESMTINECCSGIRKAASEDAECVFVDYVGLLRPDDQTQRDSRYMLITEASIRLKAAARQAGINVIVLVQVGRGGDKDPETPPKLSDLRESGQIEQDADAVVFVHRPDKGDEAAATEECAFVIAKQRNGPTGFIEMLFRRESMRFSEPE